MFNWANSLQDECLIPFLHFPCSVSAAKQAFYFSSLAKFWQPFQNQSPPCSFLPWQFAWDSLMSSSSVYFGGRFSLCWFPKILFRNQQSILQSYGPSVAEANLMIWNGVCTTRRCRFWRRFLKWRRFHRATPLIQGTELSFWRHYPNWKDLKIKLEIRAFDCRYYMF